MNPFKVGDRVVASKGYLADSSSASLKYGSRVGVVVEVEGPFASVEWPRDGTWMHVENLAPQPPVPDVEGALKALHELYEASQRDEYTDTDCGASSTRPVACLGKPLPEGGL